MTGFDFHKFRIDNITAKIKEEVIFYEKFPCTKIMPFVEYIDYLKNRIGINLPVAHPIVRYDRTGKKYEIKKLNMDEYTKEIDVYTFRRPWTKLREFHKIMKIKEYVNELSYNNKTEKGIIERNRQNLQKKLCQGLKDKKFGKGKCEIVYDQELMKIISISCVYYDKRKGLYVVDWDS